MTDYTLKFPDEATATEVLEPFIATHAIDTIGVIYKPTGEMLLGEDGEYPAMAPIAGWHVNLRVNEDVAEVNAESDAVQELILSEKLQALAPYIVQVNTPARVWA